MKEILKYLQQLWIQAGFPDIASYIATLVASLGVLSFLWNLGARLWKFRQQRKLLKDLHPFYTVLEIQRATQYYVETKCQSVAPAKADEPRDSFAFAPKEKVLPFFLKKAFKPAQDECQFYIVLADSGMGKTTFMLNLYLRYINQFFKPTYHIRLFPLGFPGIDKEIEGISNEDKKKTILLLDAFDEDMLAVEDYKTRLHDLIHRVLYFREVVITCRTQFFPSVEEEPRESGVLLFGGERGYREFYKLYLSPFDNRDIRTYLRKRFRWYQIVKKYKAHQIVKASPNLMVRPMLLSYIEDLLQSQRRYTATYMIYEELINKWIEREAKRVPQERREQYKQELFRFSREIALNIYRHREERHSALLIPGGEIQPFAERHGINLKDMEMKSRSLLNRNAQGQYKFSHKSVLEYFLAVEAFSDQTFRKEMNFEGMDQAQVFFNELVWEKMSVLKGEYSLKNGKPKALAAMSMEELPEVTSLNLTEWNRSDDLLLLKGLKKLEKLDVTKLQITPDQKNEIQHALPECTLGLFRPLRSKPMTVSEKKFREVFGLDKDNRPLTYIQNDYEDQDNVVIDHATGLMWQKSDSGERLTYTEAEEYVKTLNSQKFANHDDWRLPTIPELMSLLEPEEQENGLYLNTIFDASTAKEGWNWAWSADRRSSGAAWSVSFDDGNVYWNLVRYNLCVRCVRSRQ